MATRSMHVTTMEMDFAKFTSIRWKDFGRCCDPGSGHIVVSRKKSCRTTSRFFNSSTTHANEEKHSSNRSLSAYSPDLPETPDEPTPRRLPTILSKDEVGAILSKIPGGPKRLLICLLYGSGLRLMEGCRLRVTDLDFDRKQLIATSRNA